MPQYDYDLLVLGGGSAGYAAASQGMRLGLRVAIVEGGEHVGGLCILAGCMPSKALLESGHRAETIRRAEEFGLRATFHGADGPAIRARKRRLIDDFASYRTNQLEEGKWTFIRGSSSFMDAHTVEIAPRDGSAGQQRISAGTFVIATGSEISWIDLPGLREAGVMTSDAVLDSDQVPGSVVVIGGGAIAVECASYYAGLGVRVTILQRSGHLVKEMDPEISSALAGAFRKRGIQVWTSTRLQSVECVPGGMKTVRFHHAGGDAIAEGEEIVYALGRHARTGGLGLEAAGVALHEKGNAIRVAPTQQTSVPHIFAAGDVCGPFEVVHSAIAQGELAVRNAARLLGVHPPHTAEGGLERMDYRLKLFAVFSHPELASVGATAQELTATGASFVEATYPFDDHGKSIVRGETEGFVKLIADPVTRRILGGAVIGPEASELIHEIAVAMHFNATAGQLAAVPHYHPTLSEIWTYPAEALAEM